MKNLIFKSHLSPDRYIYLIDYNRKNKNSDMDLQVNFSDHSFLVSQKKQTRNSLMTSFSGKVLEKSNETVIEGEFINKNSLGIPVGILVMTGASLIFIISLLAEGIYALKALNNGAHPFAIIQHALIPIGVFGIFCVGFVMITLNNLKEKEESEAKMIAFIRDVSE